MSRNLNPLTPTSRQQPQLRSQPPARLRLGAAKQAQLSGETGPIVRGRGKLVAFVALALAFGAACGYRFTGGGDLPGGVQRVFVELLENRTSETGIETILTGDLIYEFTRSRRSALAKDRASADSVLEGEIHSLKFNTISRRGVYTSRERKVTVTIDLRLIGPDGQILWQENGIAESENYDVVEDKLVTEQNRRRAIEELSERIAERVFNRLTDDF